MSKVGNSKSLDEAQGLEGDGGKEGEAKGGRLWGSSSPRRRTEWPPPHVREGPALPHTEVDARGAQPQGHLLGGKTQARTGLQP